MEKFFIGKQVTMGMSFEIEAKTEEEAKAILQSAWENDDAFLHYFSNNATIYDSTIYVDEEQLPDAVLSDITQY